MYVSIYTGIGNGMDFIILLRNCRTAAGCHSFAAVLGSDGIACRVPKKVNTPKDHQSPKIHLSRNALLWWSVFLLNKYKKR